jgi:serine/threonine protein phosphatase PrpC
MANPSEDTAEFILVPDFAEAFFAPFHTSLSVAFGAASHIGNVRPENEDHYAVFRQRRGTELVISSIAPEDLDIPETSSYSMVVADGMGGMKSGELASRLAIQTLLELASHATSWVMKLTDPDAQQIGPRVRAYVQKMQETIRTQGTSHPSLQDMGTTWTSAHLLGSHAVIVHLGDSRAYLLREGELRQVTRDETMAQALVDSGMEPESVRRFGHILLNSLGGGNDTAKAAIHHLELVPNDRLLLCTDGLTDMVEDEQIASELQRHTSPQAACEALVQRALANGGRDNVTVVLASTSESEEE